MAQDIIIRMLCDVCLSQDEQRDNARTYPLPGGLEIDLCEIHGKPFADLIEHARPSEAKTAAAAKPGTACPDCGKVLKTPRGLRKHRTQAHGTPETEIEGEVGGTLFGTDGETCPDCGKAFAKPQGLSMHRFRAHGVTSQTPDAIRKREREAMATESA